MKSSGRHRLSVGFLSSAGSQYLRAGLHRPGVLGGEFRHVVGLAGQVADHPGVVHAVAGRRALRMVVAGQDLDRVVLAHLEHLLAELGVAVALRRA